MFSPNKHFFAKIAKLRVPEFYKLSIDFLQNFKYYLQYRPNNHMSMQHIAKLLGAPCCLQSAAVMCCDMLGVVGLRLKMLKFEPTTPNMAQHSTTGWSNACNMLHPTMLNVALCCDCLAGV